MEEPVSESGPVHPAPAPGWYADPEVPGRQRWWDGSTWTEHTHPLPPGPPPVPPAPSRSAPGAFGRRGGRPLGPNSLAHQAMVVTAVYLALAASIHFFFLGIFPAFMVYRSFQRREPQAPLALATLVLFVVVSFAVIR